jgi:enoyl-CoA hydratase/carnithine racemase
MISGACVGGGCGLALGCDIRIADRTAKLGITPAKLGLAYSVADTKRLVDAVGFAHATDLLFSGRLVGAEEAQRLGLVSRVVEPAALESETLEVARAAAANAASSLRSIKAALRAIRAGRSADDDATRQVFADAFQGADFAEGLAAYFERRKPRFE